MINWDLSLEEEVLVGKIAERAIKEVRLSYPKFSKLDLIMDITATHNENGKLRLEDWLNADDSNFYHDIFGIMRHMDRETGQLKNFFEPRFTDYDIVQEG